MPHEQAHHWRAFLVLLAILVGVIGVLYISAAHITPTSDRTDIALTSGFPDDVPPPTASDLVSVQQGFQHLVQYTDTGVHPSSLTITSGETVRFANASFEGIQLTGDGQSQTLSHGQYWEYSPASRGAVSFTAGAFTITITVD